MCYIGVVRTEWLEERGMLLLDDFAFVDDTGFEWVAPKNSIIDGSSIPRFAWSLVGSPYVGLHRNASVIHDVFCQFRNQPVEKVHRMYYDAIRFSGIGKSKAKLMYQAIKIGGPKW